MLHPVPYWGKWGSGNGHPVHSPDRDNSVSVRSMASAGGKEYQGPAVTWLSTYNAEVQVLEQKTIINNK